MALELRNYIKIAHPGTSISKPGYLKQRMKLNPDAFLELYKYHNRNFYADSSCNRYFDTLLRCHRKSIITKFLFKPIEFDRFKIGIVNLLPQAVSLTPEDT